MTTRFPYDGASKKVLAGALEGAGTLLLNREVRGEPQYPDGWFVPDAHGRPPGGVLGRMTERACALEAFSEAPSVEEGLDCLAKQLTLWREERLCQSPQGVAVPRMWLICAGRPTTALGELAVTGCVEWGDGFYRISAAALPFYIVVVGELPCTRETLVLRLMGRGPVLAQALEDLRLLPPDAWERRAAAGALDVLRSAAVPGAESLEPDEEAIIMTATEVYEQIKDEGRREAWGEGQRALVLKLLQTRFGDLPEEVRARIDAGTPGELETWAERLLTAGSLDEVFQAN